jgi:hypothetical protein
VGQEVRDVCRDAGFDGFLAKPADRDAIAAEMHRLAGPGIRKPSAAAAAAQPAPAAGRFTEKGAGEPAASSLTADAAGCTFPGGIDFDTPGP